MLAHALEHMPAHAHDNFSLLLLAGIKRHNNNHHPFPSPQFSAATECAHLGGRSLCWPICPQSKQHSFSRASKRLLPFLLTALEKPPLLRTSSGWRMDSLGRNHEAVLTLNLAKCELAPQDTWYLGYQLGREEVHPQVDKVTAILDCLWPCTKKKVWPFYGLIG